MLYDLTLNNGCVLIITMSREITSSLVYWDWNWMERIDCILNTHLVEYICLAVFTTMAMGWVHCDIYALCILWGDYCLMRAIWYINAGNIVNNEYVIPPNISCHVAVGKARALYSTRLLECYSSYPKLVLVSKLWLLTIWQHWSACNQQKTWQSANHVHISLEVLRFRWLLITCKESQ